MTLISAMSARVAGVGGAGLRWMAKRALMVQPLGWSMYCSGEVMLSRRYDRDQKKIAEAVRGLPAEKTSWLVRTRTRARAPALDRRRARVAAAARGVVVSGRLHGGCIRAVDRGLTHSRVLVRVGMRVHHRLCFPRVRASTPRRRSRARHSWKSRATRSCSTSSAHASRAPRTSCRRCAGCS